MNIRVFLLPALMLFALTGCGQKGPETSSDSGSSAAAPTASTPANGARTVEITASDQMKFNVTAITAKPGESLHIVLTNTGSLPKEAMAHNWILLKSGSDPIAFATAAAGARDTGYIPQNLSDEIVAHIDLQGPHQTGEVTFNAPTAPGDYPYLCSFPGHAAVGMKGVLTVK